MDEKAQLPRLVITADDLGYAPGVTRGIVEAAERGVVTGASLVVNRAESKSAVVSAKGLELGLHVNLTRGEPVSELADVRTLVNREGQFALHSADEFSAAATSELRAELAVQLRRFADLTGTPPAHVSVHRRWLELVIWPLLLEVTREQAPRAFVRARAAATREAFRAADLRTCDLVLGNVAVRGLEPEWTFDHLMRTLASLPSGVVELVCHPGYAHEEELRGSAYSWQREAELRLFGAASLAAVVERFARRTTFAELL